MRDRGCPQEGVLCCLPPPGGWVWGLGPRRPCVPRTSFVEPSSLGHMVSHLLCTAGVCEVPATSVVMRGFPGGGGAASSL